LLPFRDIEDSIAMFDGENDKTDRCIEDLEDAAKLCSWNKVQKVIYAKKYYFEDRLYL